MFNIAEFPVIRLLGSATRGAVWRRRAPAAALAGRSVPVRRLTLKEQWDRISGVLTAAFADSDRARDLQVRAAQQIDLASYALYNLVDELSLVMQEPLGRVRASIHQFEQPQLKAVKAVRAA